MPMNHPYQRRAAVVLGALLALAAAPERARAQMFLEAANVLTDTPITNKFGDPTSGIRTRGGEAVAVFDANDDGRDDFVIVSASAGPYYHVVLNERDESGAPRFVVQPPTYIGVLGDQKSNSPAGFGLHDFDRDGRLDLYLANGGRGSLMMRNRRPPWDLSASNIIDTGLYRDSSYRVQIAQGDGTFVHQDIGADGEGTSRAAVFADFDRDGADDALLSNAPYFGLWWSGSSVPNQLLPGHWDGSFGSDVLQEAVVGASAGLWKDALGRANKDFKGIVVRDFDRDGKPDVVLSAIADVWDNVAVPPVWTMDPSGALLDLDGDGLPDGGYQGDWERGILVLRNVSTKGAIRFEDVSSSAIDNALGGESRMHSYVSVPADIDSDGDLDLLCSGIQTFFAQASQANQTDRIRVYRNDSTPGNIVFTNVTASSGVDFMNHDEGLEQFTEGLYPIVIPNTMLDGSDFVMTPLLSAGAALDIDNDGDVDWVLVDRQLLSRNPLTGEEFALWVLLNDGTGRFDPVPASEHGLVHTARDLSYGDFDQDGRVDLVAVNGSGGGQTVDDNNYVFLNNVDNDNHWIDVTVSTRRHPLGLGSKVAVYAAGTNHLLGYEELRTDFAYRSKRSARLHFGLGNVSAVDVRITPPGSLGAFWLHQGLPVDRTHHFRTGGACGLLGIEPFAAGLLWAAARRWIRRRARAAIE